MVTASALMATLFLGGWDLPGAWDNAFWYNGQLISGFAENGAPIAAQPAVWKTLLTFGGFAAKTGFFLRGFSFFSEQPFAILMWDLVIIRMNFAKGQETVTIATKINEGRL